MAKMRVQNMHEVGNARYQGHQSPWAAEADPDPAQKAFIPSGGDNGQTKGSQLPARQQ